MAKEKAGGAAIGQQLARLAALRGNPTTAEARAELAQALAGRTNLAAAKAADIIRDARLLDLVPDLVRAFDHFMPDGTDKGCAAKTAIAKALDVLEQNEQDVFLRGERHVQLEPIWGGSADAAAELRGICAAGLARTNYRDVAWELANLLGDPDPGARAAAARAIAHAGRDDGAALLRLKIRTGDREPAVMGECFLALLRLAPAKGMPVVSEFLDDADDDLRTAALMALAESRLPAAFDLLRGRYEAEPSGTRRAEMLLPIALTRQPGAVELLITIVGEQRPPTAAAAMAALTMYRHDAAVRGRVERIVRDRNEPELTAAFEKHLRLDR